MKYREKHKERLKRVLGAAALTASMMIPGGCTNSSNQDVKEQQQSGLLDARPQQVSDKYGTQVILYHVNIPIYTKNGERKKDQYVLTRGLKHSAHKTNDHTKYIRKAFINNSSEPFYVQTGSNGEIYTERGFAGLFVDGEGKVEVIADANVGNLLNEKEQARKAEIKNQRDAKAERLNKIQQQTAPADSGMVVLPQDTTALPTDIVLSDTLTIESNKTDSNANANLADTLNLRHQEIRN